MSEAMIEGDWRITIWTGIQGFSYHRPILLQFNIGRKKFSSPIKFNPSWATDQENKKLINKFWAPYSEKKVGFTIK